MKTILLNFALLLSCYTYSQIITLDKNINDTLRNKDIIRISKKIESDLEISFNNSTKKLYKISDLNKSNADFKGININNDTLIIAKEKYKLNHLDKIKILITSKKIAGDFIFKDVNYVSKSIQPVRIVEEVTSNKNVQTISNKILFKDGDNILNDAKILINRDILDVNRKNSIMNIYNASIENPFLKNTTLNSENQSSGSLGKMGSNIAKTDVTNFATGMARFLADRAKQELNESFFIQMHKQMERIPELQMYFPESYMFLKRFNSYSSPLDLDHLRARFNQDIQKLPKNIYNTIKKSSSENGYPQLVQLKEYFDNDANGILVSYALETVLESKGKINPKDMLYKFVHSEARKNLESKEAYKQNLPVKNALNTIKLAELISNSLLSADPNRYWVTEEEIKELFTNDALLKTYIGLLLAKSNFDEYKIEFNSIPLKTLIEKEYAVGSNVIETKLPELKSLIKNMYFSYKEVDDVVSQLKGMNAAQAIDESYTIFNILKTNLDIINSQLLTVVDKEGKSYQINNEVIYNYVTPAVDISYNIYTKKYPQAIKDFSLLLQNSLNYKDLKNNKDYNKFLSRFTTYGTLIANVSAAQNSDEVKDAIQAAVLPVGSSRIKRYSDFSVMANAYVGGFYGQAYYKVEGEKKSISTFGVTAPIGVTVAWGKMKFLGDNNALSLNVQLIDLGSLVNFYYQKGDGAQLPPDTKVQLGDILAPGASVSYSLFNSPFSIFAGAQYVPNLSRMEAISTNTELKPLTWRWHAGIAIDIPLLSLWVKN